MRRVLLALSLLSFIAACAPTPAGVAVPESASLRFGSVDLEPGAVLVRSERGQLDGKMRYGLRGADLEILIEETQRLELLRLEGGVPTELRVTYEDSSSSTWNSLTGERDETISPVMRQTYRLSHRPGSVEVAQDVSLAEYSKIHDDFSTLGPQFSVPRALANRTVKVGERLTIEQDVGDEYTFEMRLLGASVFEQQAVAVFSFQMEGEAGGGRFDIEGRVLVELESARLVSMEGKGPFRAKQGGAKIKGEMSLEWRYRY